MVGGADKLCSYLADGKQTVRVDVVASKHPLFLSGYGFLNKIYSNLFYGAGYDTTVPRTSIETYRSARHAVCAGAVSEVSLFEEDIKALMHLHKSEKFTLNLMSV